MIFRMVLKKTWTGLSFVLSQFTRLIYGRTNRQTDSFLIARPRLHSMQRGYYVTPPASGGASPRQTTDDTWMVICYRPSTRPSVVCNVRAPYSGDWNFRQCFYALAICDLSV